MSPSRILFVDPLPHDTHLRLARYAAVDMVLAGRDASATAAADALFAGVPVVSVEGGPFSDRLVASLLRALDMPELVVRSWKVCASCTALHCVYACVYEVR